MAAELTSTNPLVQSIISGAAPPAARMAAARGLLPLAQTELLEALVVLRSDSDQAIAQAAQATLDSQTPEDLLNVARGADATPFVLTYLAAQTNFARDLYEAV